MTESMRGFAGAWAEVRSPSRSARNVQAAERVGGAAGAWANGHRHTPGSLSSPLRSLPDPALTRGACDAKLAQATLVDASAMSTPDRIHKPGALSEGAS